MGRGQGPPPERLRAIALNRLKALGIQAWVSQGVARGRIVVRPELFAPVRFASVPIEPDQQFQVYQHAFLAFIPPSPLAHLGGIRFYEAPDVQALTNRIRERWAALVSGTEAALQRARMFRSDATLDVPSWNIETVLTEGGRRAVFRFDGRLAALYLHAFGDHVIEHKEGVEPIAMPLSPDTAPLDDAALMPLVRVAESRFGGPASVESGPIELDLLTADVVSVDVDGVVRAKDAGSGDLSLDLDSLKTGDLHVPQPSAVEPEVVTVSPSVSDRGLSQRRPREPQSVPARLSWGGRRTDVVLADVSAGGVFVRTSEEVLLEPGARVELSDFSPVAITAKVAHVRPADESGLFATGGGLGLAFEPDAQPPGRRLQDGRWCAALVTDPKRRERTLLALDAAGCVAVMVEHLAGLAAVLVQLDLALILIDEADAERAERALGLEERAPVLAVGDGIDAAAVRAALDRKR